MWCVANEPMPAGIAVGASGGGGFDPVYEEANLPGKQFLDTELARARELDPTRLVTIVTVGGGPQNWMEKCDVICMNRYHGWYSLGGQLDKARQALEGELDQVWDRFHKPIIMTEFGADTVPGFHGLPDVMWTEEYQSTSGSISSGGRRDFIAACRCGTRDFAAVQGLARERHQP
jgi:beta-glucuronidase